MRNKRRTRIWTEGEEVHLYLPVKRELRDLLGLVALLLLTLSLFSWTAARMLPTGALMNWLFALMALAFLIYFPIRYVVWQLYGVERIIIDTQKITYSYDYGIMRSKQGEIPYRVLGLGYQKQRGRPNECGNLIFYNYQLEEESVETLLATSVWVHPDLLVTLDERIHELFVKEKLKDFNFPPFCLN